MAAIRIKTPKSGVITITDKEVIRLISTEASANNEAWGKVAARCIIRYFAMRHPVVTGTVS